MYNPIDRYDRKIAARKEQKDQSIQEKAAAKQTEQASEGLYNSITLDKKTTVTITTNTLIRQKDTNLYLSCISVYQEKLSST